MQQILEKNPNDSLDTLEAIPDAIPVVLSEPPIEDQLGWHTLWPESHKLYGHGNELFALCCDHDGKLVASSCKVNGVMEHLLLGDRFEENYFMKLKEVSNHVKVTCSHNNLLYMLRQTCSSCSIYEIIISKSQVIVILNITCIAGPISSSSRNMAMASWFMESSWSLAVS